MKYRDLFILIVLCASLFSGSAYALTPEKKEDIKKLIELKQSPALKEKMPDMIVNNGMKRIRRMHPELSEEVFDDLSRAMHKVIQDNISEVFEKLVKKMIPVYDKHYSHEEIRKLIKFYKSPVGKKQASLMVPIMQEIMPVFQKWGRKIGRLATQEAEKVLRRHGYERR